MGVASLVKILNWNQAVYRCEPPMEDHEGKSFRHVVASIGEWRNVPEVMFFPANLKLDGVERPHEVQSLRHCASHTDAFEWLGYEALA